MSLSKKVRDILRIALANKSAATELADAVDAQAAALKALTAKLDADTGVKDEDYHLLTD